MIRYVLAVLLLCEMIEAFQGPTALVTTTMKSELHASNPHYQTGGSKKALLGIFDTAGLVVESLVNSVEDVTLHLKRQAKKNWGRPRPSAQRRIVGSGEVSSSSAIYSSGSAGTLHEWTSTLDPRPRVLVLGSGWAAHALAKVVDTDRLRVLVVSPRPFFVFTPMLASSALGGVEYRSIVEPIRSANPLISYLEAEATSVDPIAKKVTCVSPLPKRREPPTLPAALPSSDVLSPPLPKEGTGPTLELGYDTLVYACGAQAASPSSVPGIDQFGYFLKEVEDARTLRRACVDVLERALAPPVTSDSERRELLTFVVVGGGPTGVEFAGELADFLGDTVRRVYASLEGLPRVVLVHGGAELLPQFEPSMRRRAAQALEKQGIEVRFCTRAVRVSERSIELKTTVTKGLESKGGASASGKLTESSSVETLPAGVVVWSGGTSPRPLTVALAAQLQVLRSKEAGVAKAIDDGTSGSAQIITRLAVDQFCRAVGSPCGSILAIGDAAQLQGADLPPTAQVAAQAGAYVARLLNHGYDLSALPTPTLKQANTELASERALLALMWGREARPFRFLNLGLLAYLGGGQALSQVMFGEQQVLAQAGSVGFLLWRSVYLAKQVATRNRVLVLFDWIKSAAFGRDTTRL